MKKIYILSLLAFLGLKSIAQTTFNYTGGVQTYTVPAGVTSITVDAQGAKGGGVDCAYGGGTYQSHGGCGGRVQATLSVTPGHVLNITVGGAGANTGGGGYGGGGSDLAFSTTWPGAGGGGGTRIVDNTTGTLLVVAGGGGGGGGDFCAGSGYGLSIGDAGGAGGGLTGGNGTSNICGAGTGGKGGTPTTGGAAGVCSGMSGSAGSLATGANCTTPDVGSGGGGGGYYGGGSGGYSAGGGGGSSYTNATYASAITHTQGYTCGNGLCIINVACTPPAVITSATTFAVCSGSTITLSDATTGGTWSSSASGIASVSATGVVTGMGAGGTATISYTISTGCYALATVTVNPLPAAISGTPVLCAGNNTTLTDLSGAGTWTSSNTTVATVGSASGVVYGLSTGNSTIVFTLTATGCTTSEVITVNPATASIAGPTAVCVGQIITLTDATPGGSWSSSLPGTASVVAGSGVVTGAAGGTVTITYALPSGCYSTYSVVVNPLPSGITGSTAVCQSYTTTLADASGAAGTWSSSNTGVAPVGATTGVVTGMTTGSATITYGLTATGCYTTFPIVVNALPSVIQGPAEFCANATTTLTDSMAGGTWSSSVTSVATAATGGVLTGVGAGTTIITYSLGSGCYVTRTETVDPYPAPITGSNAVCSGSSITESDITGGATWSLVGTGATIGSATGIITATLPGYVPVVDTIKYTITATGCKVVKPVTINPLPGAIAGILLICDSSTTALFNGLSGGVWTSSTTSVATVNATTGVAYGLAPGISDITYTIPSTGCMTTSALTVAPPPAPISGVQTVCPLLTTTLSDGSVGYWLSGSPGIATIDSFTGLVHGISSGTAVVTYVLGVCSTSVVVTVNPLPASIGGPNYVCTNGATITLTDATPGGSWSSSSSVIAPINATSGVLTGMSTGTAVATYQLSATGCYQTQVITVDPLPAPITGADSVCLGYSTVLADATSGGIFSSSTTVVATVGAYTGAVTGASAGSTVITYTLLATGCWITTAFHVNPILNVSTVVSVSPDDTICAGNIATYSAASVNEGTSPVYQWKVNTATIAGATGSSYSYAPINGDVVKCILTSNATCAIPNAATSNSIHMTVNPVTYPTVTMSPGSTDTLCTGTVQTYSVTSMWGGVSPVYLWTVNWAPVGTGSTSYTYTPSNGDIIRCGMISSSQCPVPDTAFAIDTVVVEDYKTTEVTINGLASLSACQGNMVTLTANESWGGWGPTYSWTVNGVSTGTFDNTYTYLPTNNDSVVVTMVSNYLCPVPGNVATGQITVIVDPVIVVTITDSYGGLISEGSYDTLVAHVANGGLDPTYQWYRNGTPIPGANYYKVALNTFVDKDSISVMVVTGSGNSCAGVRGYNWLILQVAPEGVAQVQSGMGDLKLMPNPSNGTFRVSGNVNTNCTTVGIRMTNVIGQEVYNGSAVLNSGKIDEVIGLNQSLPDGVYTLRIGCDDRIFVGRVEIRR